MGRFSLHNPCWFLASSALNMKHQPGRALHRLSPRPSSSSTLSRSWRGENAQALKRSSLEQTDCPQTLLRHRVLSGYGVSMESLFRDIAQWPTVPRSKRTTIIKTLYHFPGSNVNIAPTLFPSRRFRLLQTAILKAR